MPRHYTVEKTAYTWEELSETAKDTARQEWSRFLWEDGSMQENCQMIFEDTLTDAGWTDLGDLSYSLYMGGYPAWTGTLPAFEYAGITYVLSTSNRRGNMSIELELDEDNESAPYGTPEWDAAVARIESAERAARDHVYSLSHDLYVKFEAEDEYQTSDEQMAETSEANGFEYDEDGHLI